MLLLIVVVALLVQCTYGSPAESNHFLEDSALLVRVIQSIKHFENNGVSREDRSLGIYHIGHIAAEDSPDVIENNVKIFSAAVLAHTDTATHKAFYIFCVVGGADHVLSKYLPYASQRATFVRCPAGHNDLSAHIHTISLLGDTIVSKFYSVLFLGHHARGPFIDHMNGAWWNHFTDIFRSSPSIALLGPLISCEMAPHVQTHAFAMRSEVVVEIFAEFNPRRVAGRRNKARHLETSISTETINLGYSISSIYYHKEYNRTVFNGTCAEGRSSCELYKLNPTSWCDLVPQEIVFVKWGGPPLRIRGYYCQETIDMVQQATLSIAQAERDLHLVLPETIHGGHFYALNKEYDLEMWRDRSLVPYIRPAETVGKVCFLVRTAYMQGHKNDSRAERMDLNVLMKSLMRQSNPNWEAYFFVTDDHPFEQELQEIIRKHGDIRLNYLEIGAAFKPKYEQVSAAYPASDEALRIVSQKPQCAWLSVTNGDNAYGSAVVGTVLEPHKPVPNLIMLPMSSRNFDNRASYEARKERKANGVYSEFCVDFERMYLQKKYGFARVPDAVIGAVDIAEIFIERDKFVSTNVFFNDFNSKKVNHTCRGCQDGAWTHSMVYDRNWTMHRPPLRNLATMVFHGPSPLWCVAAGNVWFDHGRKINPDNACVSHKTIGELYPHPYFDWDYFHRVSSPKICLRLSERGFANKQKDAAHFV